MRVLFFHMFTTPGPHENSISLTSGILLPLINGVLEDRVDSRYTKIGVCFNEKVFFLYFCCQKRCWLRPVLSWLEYVINRFFYK